MDVVGVHVVRVQSQRRPKHDATVVVGEEVVEAVLVPVLRSLGRLRRALRLVRQLPVLVLARDTRLVVVDLGHLPC